MQNNRSLINMKQNDIDKLIEYLYTLNRNINWNSILDKHMQTTDEKFIKHIKSLTWTDKDEVREDNDLENHVLNLLLNFSNRRDILKILKPNYNTNIPAVLKSSLEIVLKEYTDILEISQLRYKLIDVEEDGCILFGSITKKISYNCTMILDQTLPIFYGMSDVLNNLIMCIWVNLNSMEFDFQKYDYEFVKIN